jgi:hypothetical protein
MVEYGISDSGGIELLFQCCRACDRAEELRLAIDRDGAVVQTRTGPKDHPALRHELANRAFVARSLQRLGLNLEPVRTSKGRPGFWEGV